MKGILIGGMLGGLVMFFWGFVAHMVLPFGEMGLIEATPAQQDAVLGSVKDNFQSGPGVYIVPMDMQAMKDPAKAKEAGARALANPYAFVVYQPQGRDTINNMGSNLGIEWATNTVCALLVAFLVSFATVGFVMRALLVLGTGVFGWLANAVPMWNWYRFPTDFTMAALIMQSIGWLLVGLVVAWALKRFAR
jgi:hypothetical protein